MVLSAIARISGAIVVSALLMLLALFDWPLLELLSSMPYDRAMYRYCHTTHWRADASLSATILSIAIFVFAPVGVAVFAAFSVAKARVRSGALAATASVLLAYLAGHFWFAGVCGWWSYIPKLSDLSLALITSLALGAFSAWLALKWRPNKSPGRTRGE
jgi:hypothetical protein